MNNPLNADWLARHVRQSDSAHLVIYDNNFPLGSGARIAKHRRLTQTHGWKMSLLADAGPKEFRGASGASVASSLLLALMTIIIFCFNNRTMISFRRKRYIYTLGQEICHKTMIFITNWK